jgi:hypothetical protein
MKRTPKLNTVEIADKLNELAADAAMIALAAERLFKSYGNRGTSGMVRRAYAIHDELADLSHTICPPPPYVHVPGRKP